MMDAHMDLLRKKLDEKNLRNLTALANPHINKFLAETVELCAPDSIIICTDAPEDIRHMREQAAAKREERPLQTEGHTYHFDGMNDQGRDREVTKYLVPKTDKLGKALNQIEREEGLSEIRGLLKDAMKGRIMIVRFLSLGPTDSVFSIPCVQCTDSFYVAHSEDLLYRPAYEQFKKLKDRADFFGFVHSAGKMDENMVSIDSDNKRIYIDYTYDRIYSVNTQYAGNTVGLKKLALRLTIRKADREGWLAEHMFLIGVTGPKGRKTYFGGAFPSACGKTSTAMLKGETILGDDIAYFRKFGDEARAVNAERGIFGIIQDINPKAEPSLYKVLTSPGEIIFSNVLVKDGKPYWLGMNMDTPKDGVNFSGPWTEGKKDKQGNAIPLAHKNARYTVALPRLENVDPELDNPNGVAVGGLMYGGRDTRTYVPVQQSFSWEHGIVAYGASLETETTYAILGEEGRPELNLMSIQDFVAIPLGKYVQNNLDFAKGLRRPPLIFGVNYFLRGKDGTWVNEVRDKAVWVKWMELRVHGDVKVRRTPTGWIPMYEDLQRLFREVHEKAYSKEDYLTQFETRVKENIKKMDRVEHFYRTQVSDAPAAVYKVLHEQRQRLVETQGKFGDNVSPEKFPVE